MYGHISRVIKLFLTERFGEEQWREIAKRSRCDMNFNEHEQYDDGITTKILDAAADILRMKHSALLQLAGEYYFTYMRNHGYDELLRNLGDNMLAFIENLDYIHTYVMNEFPEANMPSFRCDPESVSDQMTLHYYSFHEGLYPLTIGFLRSAARVYFKSELKIEVLSRAVESVAAKSRGQREHVVFSLHLVKGTVPEDGGPPTFLAQTKKGGEKPILKQDIEHVLERLEEIRRVEGEGGLPLNKGRTAKAKWKSLARLSVLYGGFVPLYPPTLSIDAHTFCNSFPYHFIFDPNMTIIHSGIKIQQVVPTIRTHEARVTDHFDLLHPKYVDFTFENTCKFINTPFMLKTRKQSVPFSKAKPTAVSIVLRGQMIYMEDSDLIIYLCSPFVRSLKDLEERQMHLADIPIHDVTRDLLWMELMARYRKGHGSGRQHLATPADGRRVSDRYSPALLAAPPPGMGGYDLEQLRAHCSDTQAALDYERQRTESMFSYFLPPTVAAEMARGDEHQAQEYRDVTVLFSDIVAFGEIIARCTAYEVIQLITQLHQKFQRVCAVHETYRVETIGDAYMVVCGVPEPVSSHAERIANTALGMVSVAKDVTSPIGRGNPNGGGVTIRVGIHTGKALAGVVEDKLPRFMVLGDAVTMASRMESHGVPDKVHVSQASYQILKKRGFELTKRGQIEIRGQKGKVKTYFLVSNENVSKKEILGMKSRHGDVRLTITNENGDGASYQSNDSRSQLTPKNRIYPSSNKTKNTTTTPLNRSPPGSAASWESDDFVKMVYDENLQ